MKKILIPVLAGLAMLCAHITVQAQEFKEHISKQFTLQKPAAETVVGIYNIFGNVKVEGYDGNTVQIEIDKTISAKTQEEVEKGKREFKLEFVQKSDSIYTYIDTPWYNRPNDHYHRFPAHREIWYIVKLEYTVKVPYNVILDASTVNNGNVYVKNAYGTLNINNVNGSIDIENAKGTTHAHTINGPLTINYLAVPPDNSSYYTLNGQLRVTYPANLSAELELKSMNGQFYTDFENLEVMPTKIVKTTQKDNSATIYKLSEHPDIRVGAGGKTFKFETMNGNIFIKKQE